MIVWINCALRCEFLGIAVSPFNQRMSLCMNGLLNGLK